MAINAGGYNQQKKYVANPVVVYKKPASKAKAPAYKASSGGGSTGSGGGGGDGGYAAAQKKAANAAAKKYAAQVEILQQKVTPLNSLLNGGYMEALNKRLTNVLTDLGLKDTALLESYEERVSGLKDNAKDNEKAFADTSYTNLANRGRERTLAVAEAAAQGAGESDVLKASLMSLRSWDANQNEGNRSYFDSARSINSSLNDLNVDTKTGRLNFQSQAESDRDALWTEYYNKMGESYTQLGNVKGEQASMYANANEMKSSSSYKSGQKSKSKESGEAFAKAAEMSTKVYAKQGPSAELAAWEGEADIEASANNSVFDDSPTTIKTKKPEGATLRKWA